MKIKQTEKFRLLNSNITIGKTSKSVKTSKIVKVSKRSKNRITANLGDIKKIKRTGCKGCSRKRGQ